MSDENTSVYSAINGALAFRLAQNGDKTFVLDAVTGQPVYVIDGNVGGGGVKVMTTEERTATTPAAGALIYDSTDGNLYVGDGVTVGGTPVSNSELETRVDTLEETVGILVEGGEPVSGSYIFGDWTDWDDGDSVIFGDWTPDEDAEES